MFKQISKLFNVQIDPKSVQLDPSLPYIKRTNIVNTSAT